MKQQQPKRLFRSPKGVVTNKPIYVRLMPEELEEFQQIANQEVRSISAQARLFIVEAMERYRNKAEHQ
ncbi:hypothetical protein [Idiomarina abyssalis]|uniref:hypothetical protein n=1 Tax=Idiomarina abyssalis TaxID=86102 RepID=UPI001CD6F763|nr:hypothetical protein [Idiomarina abyssalis]